ncbi:hypothetical protein L1987_09436 [Smallanthus sonchifolius]|uniref:Uncharacterized protein n=1 Tax=Smallanthus sonchifolius TaxID=185202 RepID=A0ACB9JPU6_9ASTR|nr:hypothetical protein L1987_09436 [Smallanthus sonchifolius]
MHTDITFWLDAMDMRRQCILEKRFVDKKEHHCLQTDFERPTDFARSLGSVMPVDSSTLSAATTAITASPVCDVRTVQRQRTRMYSNLRRALSFDDMDVHELSESDDEEGGEEVLLDVEADIGSGRMSTEIEAVQIRIRGENEGDNSEKIIQEMEIEIKISLSTYCYLVLNVQICIIGSKIAEECFLFESPFQNRKRLLHDASKYLIKLLESFNLKLIGIRFLSHWIKFT